MGLPKCRQADAHIEPRTPGGMDMRRQVLFVALTFVVLSPLVLVARNQDGSFRPVWAGEKPRPTAPTSEEGTGMADIYIEVTGAGDSSYNGNYWVAGEYNGKPYYALPGAARFLYWREGYTDFWCLADQQLPPDGAVHRRGGIPNDGVGEGVGRPGPALTRIADKNPKRSRGAHASICRRTW